MTIISVSESAASLSDVFHLDNCRIVCIGLPLLQASLLVQRLNLPVNAIDDWVGNRISTQGETKVIWRTHQYIFQLYGDLVVNLVQTEIQMFELWASHQVPVSRFVTLSVASHFTFDRIEDGDGFLRFLLLLQLFVFLYDGVALFQLSLISLDLVCWERNSTEAVKNGHQILRCQSVFSEAKELNRTILFKDRSKLLHAGATEVVIGEIEDLDVAIHC